ncbi:hypothetical protein F4803DRAFT_557664 [Xylaria telfairii]|nr:hypothetical protein F4803DRAFT_557664 [Xylaria telfairii]
MEDFEFGRACMMITAQLTKTKRDAPTIWRKWFPTIIYEEIRKAEELYPIVGLRSVKAMQQCICRRAWEFFFKNTPLPWVEVITDTPSFGTEEEMEISVMKDAMKIAYTDTKAALTMFRTNRGGKPATDKVEVVTPEISKVSSPPKPKPGPTPATKPVVVPVVPVVKAPKPAPKPAPELSDDEPYFGVDPVIVSRPKRTTPPKPAPKTAPTAVPDLVPKAAAGPSNYKAAPKPQAVSKTQGPRSTAAGISVEEGKQDGIDEAIKLLKKMDLDKNPELQSILKALEKNKGKDVVIPPLDSPALPQASRLDLSSGPTVTRTTISNTNTKLPARCPFGPWERPDGSPMPCMPGVGPGEIPLPDSMDPRLYLLPIKTDIEAWLNVDLYFAPKSTKPPRPSKIQILPAKWRGQPRPAEIDLEYGLRAFDVLLDWVRCIAQKGEIVPIIPFIRTRHHMESSRIGVLQKVDWALQQDVGRAMFQGKIKLIGVDRMQEGSSKHPNITKRNAAKDPAPQTKGGKPTAQIERSTSQKIGPSTSQIPQEEQDSVRNAPWKNAVAYVDIFKAALGKRERMAGLYSSSELELFGSIFMGLAAQMQRDELPTVENIIRYVGNYVLTPFTTLFKRSSWDDYKELLDETQPFVRELIREAGKVFGFEAECLTKECWYMICAGMNGIRHNVALMELPLEVPKESEESLSGLTTVPKSLNSDGGSRVMQAKTLDPPGSNEPTTKRRRVRSPEPERDEENIAIESHNKDKGKGKKRSWSKSGLEP